MPFTFAGRYSPEAFVSSYGVPLRNISIYVYYQGTDDLATLYSDRSKSGSLPNPLVTDAHGNAAFYAEPGYYDLFVNGITLTNVVVPIDPDEPSNTADHIHEQGDVVGLLDDLADISPTEHTHEEADVTDLVGDLADKAALLHDHDADYSATTHDHDTDYAVTTHDHDADYEPIGGATIYETIIAAASDESTAITTGTAKLTFRMPFAMTVTAVRASLTTASSSGTPTFDINEAGTTILSTKITIDATEKTSVTAATPPVISDASLADDAEMTVDFDVAGTGAKGVKIYLIGYRT